MCVLFNSQEYPNFIKIIVLSLNFFSINTATFNVLNFVN